MVVTTLQSIMPGNETTLSQTLGDNLLITGTILAGSLGTSVMSHLTDLGPKAFQLRELDCDRRAAIALGTVEGGQRLFAGSNRLPEYGEDERFYMALMGMEQGESSGNLHPSNAMRAAQLQQLSAKL
jgi:hypothetical protein